MKSELYHHGILGMKWGIRRYQNKDGTYTPAGKKRRRDRTSNWSDDAKTVDQLKRKSINEMSNAELRKLTERAQLEQNYKKFNPNAIKKGWKYVVLGAGVMGTALSIYNSSNQLVTVGKIVGNGIANAVGNQLMKELNRNGL